MPKGPRGENRPGSVVGAAIKVARIAVREIDESSSNEADHRRGRAGGARRAEILSPAERKKIAQNAALKRWGKE